MMSPPPERPGICLAPPCCFECSAVRSAEQIGTADNYNAHTRLQRGSDLDSRGRDAVQYQLNAGRVNLSILHLLTICDFENVWKRRVRRESRVALWTGLVWARQGEMACLKTAKSL